jgi:hypothetical protein
MKHNARFFFVLLLLVIPALACQAVSSGTETVTSNEPAEAPQPQILFEDDFSKQAHGWDTIRDEEGVTDYENGGYRIFIDKTEWYFWSTPGVNFSDVIIRVDATKLGGPDNNEFGVICRYVDADNFYFFTAASDGYYSINKFFEGEQSFVGMEEMQFNDDVINLGNASNVIKASCIGSNLTLEVNGTILADVTDADIQTGDVGLIASTWDVAGTDILFDNFVVTKP